MTTALTQPTEANPPVGLATGSGRDDGLRGIPMTYEEYLNWAADKTHTEWASGRAIDILPAGTRHQEMVALLLTILRIVVRRRRLGQVLTSPYEMLIPGKDVARAPDLLFVAAEHSDRLTPKRLVGAADLAIELISDDSVGRDRAEKFYEYAEAGVREYVIIDPREGKERIDHYLLDEEGQYQPLLPDEAGRHLLRTVPGCWIERAWLLQEELPDELTLAQAMLAAVEAA